MNPNNQATGASHVSGTSMPVDPSAPHRVASAELLRGQKRLIIEHGETSYTLLLTRNGKLILTK